MRGRLDGIRMGLPTVDGDDETTHMQADTDVAIADLVAAYQTAYDIADSIAQNHPDWSEELSLAKYIMQNAGTVLYSRLP